MIPGATVTLTSEKTGQARSSATDSEGRFNFAEQRRRDHQYRFERRKTRNHFGVPKAVPGRLLICATDFHG